MTDFNIKKINIGRPSLKPSVEDFAKVADGKTIKEIAKHYNVSTVTIRTWLKLYDAE